MDTPIIFAIIVAMGIPSAVTGFCFWLLQRNITKANLKRDEHEKKKEKCEVLLIQSVSASISLGEACAIALRDGKTNGETKHALEYAQKVKNEQRDFLTQVAAQNIIN